MKPVTAETVKAEIDRLEGSETLSMRETFYLNCLRNLLAALTPNAAPKKS